MAAIAVVVNVDNHTMEGLTNLDGGQHSRREATDNTTTNHGQEHWRGDDVGRGCSNSESRGKGEGMVAAALAAVAVAVVTATATAATTTTMIAAERVRQRQWLQRMQW